MYILGIVMFLVLAAISWHQMKSEPNNGWHLFWFIGSIVGGIGCIYHLL